MWKSLRSKSYLYSMLQAHELRPGSIIQLGNNHLEREDDKIVYIRVHEKNIGFILHNLEQYAPIPLIPVILRLCGFEKKPYFNDSDNYQKGNYIYTPGVGWFQQRIDEKLAVKLCEELFYMHELQNVMFDLTGEQLQIKHP